jgi:hypothetical protein
MSNNVGTPLFYVGIAMFSAAILYTMVNFTTTDDYGEMKPTKAFTDYFLGNGGATIRHKKKHGKGKTHKKY